MRNKKVLAGRFVLAVAVGIFLFRTENVFAHCDTMDGPIIPEAQRALDSGDLTPVLKWVRAKDEAIIREAFSRTRAARSKGENIRELADQFFLETLIRIHREGEGAPYRGLKPAGSVAPVFGAADAALDGNSVDKLAEKIAATVRDGIRNRFNVALERRKHADDSVEKGREYVEAYVDYMHFVEGIHDYIHHAASGHHLGGEQDYKHGKDAAADGS